MTYEGASLVLIRRSALPLRRLPVRSVRWLDERPRDRCGRVRNPVTMPEYRRGQAPQNKGKRYAPEVLTPAEVMRLADGCDLRFTTGRRNRAHILFLFRSGLRITESLRLEPRDLDRERGTIRVRLGKMGKSATCGLDPWGFEQIQPWVDERRERFPAGPVFCVVEGPTRGEAQRSAYLEKFLHKLAREVGIDKRVTPHQLRHSLAVDMVRNGMDVVTVQRQLRHSNLGMTANYLVGLSNEETIIAMSNRKAPV